jgi:hypothetical protein
MLCMKRTNCENYFFPSQVYRALLKKTNSIPGAKVENNKFCLSVHFRCVDEKVNRNPALASFLHLFFLIIIIIIIYLFLVSAEMGCISKSSEAGAQCVSKTKTDSREEGNIN